ncbi:MAG: hypothetical protein HQL69_02900 [Magnetococcales bacterium]|nr:hypothetical protein [Magnetococcales bacterium]
MKNHKKYSINIFIIFSILLLPVTDLFASNPFDTLTVQKVYNKSNEYCLNMTMGSAGSDTVTWKMLTEKKDDAALNKAITNKLKQLASLARDKTEKEWVEKAKKVFKNHPLPTKDDISTYLDLKKNDLKQEDIQNEKTKKLFIRIDNFQSAIYQTNLADNKLSLFEHIHKYENNTEEIMHFEVQANKKSKVASQLYCLSDNVYNLLYNERLEEWREASTKKIKEADQRYKNFTKEILYHQLPWEFFINEKMWNFDCKTDVCKPLSGNLDTPPRRQIRLIHPIPMIPISFDNSQTNVNIRPVVEIAGYQDYIIKQDNSYALDSGMSIVWVPPTSEDERSGVGVLRTSNKWSVAITWQGSNKGKDGVNVLFGVDLAQLISNSSNDKMKSIKDMLGLGKERMEEALNNL